MQEIRRIGLMLGMDLDSVDRAKAVVSQLLDARRFLINRTQDAVPTILPQYVIERSSCGPGNPRHSIRP